jgi:hypothetical protein
MHARDELRDEPLAARHKAHPPAEGAAAWVSAVGNAAAGAVMRTPAVQRGGPAALARAPLAIQRAEDEEVPEEAAGGEAAPAAEEVPEELPE